MADFWDYIKRPQPYRWLIVLLSAMPAAMILIWANSEKVIGPPERPNVTYISTLASDRSNEEILQSNMANQAQQDILRARIEEFEERKRAAYRAVGRASGLDVDAMERQAAADRAREDAAAEAFRREVLETRIAPGAADAAVRSGN